MMDENGNNQRVGVGFVSRVRRRKSVSRWFRGAGRTAKAKKLEGQARCEDPSTPTVSGNRVETPSTERAPQTLLEPVSARLLGWSLCARRVFGESQQLQLLQG